MRTLLRTTVVTTAIVAMATFGTSCSKHEDTSPDKKQGEAQASGKPAAVSSDLVELAIEPPDREFQGTPKPVKLPPGLKLHKGKRGPVMVPKGTELLSKGKPVKASDDMPVIGELEQITDGEKSTADGNFIEFAPGTQWVQIDLEQECQIEAVAIWHYHAQARAYHDIIVQISDDPDFLTGVTTIFNNDHYNSSGKGVGKDEAYIESNEGWVVMAKGVKGRYVRLYSNGNTSNEMNHYIEVSVYGKPIK